MVDCVKFVVFFCVNFLVGYFNVYDVVVKDNSVDVVLYLGDYIYEYFKGGYVIVNVDVIGCSFVLGNEGELFNLIDYCMCYV